MAFKLRSGNKPKFKEVGSPMKSVTDAAYGRNRDEVFDEAAQSGADVSHLRRTNFEHPEDTKEGQAERKAHGRFLQHRSERRMSIDLKKDRRQSQLIGKGGSHDTKRGTKEITDPYGNKHRISKSGKFLGSTRGYNAESREWRKNYGKPKAKSPSKESKKIIKKDKPKVSLKKDKGLMKSKTNIGIKRISLKGKKSKGESLKEKLEKLKKK